MPLSLDIGELVPAFPDFSAALVVAEGLSIPAERPEALDAEIRRREAECRERWGGTELSAIPGVAAWRAAYRAFGIKKTSYRCSVERIVKNVLAGRELPRINAFVDAYNAVSLAHVLCVGADDVDRIEPPLAFRYSRPGDSFVDMAAEPGEDPNDPPKPGEVVYADARHVLCRRWNWRQDARTLVTPQTTGAVVTLQANGVGDPLAAADDLARLLRDSCGGACRVAVVSAASPRVSL
ncbi:phenylalanine--tRNA ligase beta subunit-related protein [Alsobacter sp. SYSU M60028]|uniref:Phenylalanine--tRNA ligase beta subunit-related protein n=1 Tax=Alsobacter ponti TaxID=2962936 RepID=A0ABT1L6Y9_9HYPH|nr:phenylalanine--tRNA ligase beta subunit-related protein [Alsobacter ponti]MCP8937162.1 phenylalanine--tRNA ligase beta subunit-related protein [Alsobacter ponti]